MRFDRQLTPLSFVTPFSPLAFSFLILIARFATLEV